MDFGIDINLGFMMFFKAIPFMIVYMVIQFVFGFVPIFGMIGILFISLFVIPMLFMNFFKKETVGSLFEFDKVTPVFNNIGEYIVVVLKSIALQIIFLIMIIVLVGIPAGSFTKNIFFADFYRRYVK